MFRATHRPSARAQKLLLQPMVLYMFLVAGRCDGWASAVVMLDTPFSEVVWRVLATYSFHQFPLHFPSRAPLYAITFQLDSTNQQRYYLCQRLHYYRSDWHVVCQQPPFVWPNKLGFFFFFKLTVWPDTDCSLHRIRVLSQWTERI